MKIKILYLITGAALSVQLGLAANENNLLENGFASVVVPEEMIVAIDAGPSSYALANSYVQLGAEWNSNQDAAFFLAGLNVIDQSPIVFLADDPADSIRDIAFEEVSKKREIPLSRTDKTELLAELHESLIFSQIKVRQIDPKEFSVDAEVVR